MARKKLIKVTFPDGTVICLSSRTETMLSVLRKIGEKKCPSSHKANNIVKNSPASI